MEHATTLLATALLDTAFVLFATLDGPSDPQGVIVLILALLALLAIVLPDLEDSPPIGTPSGTDRALLEAATDIGDGGDSRRIARRLEGVEVPEGRPRSYLDVAVRYLEMAGRYRRLEGRLRGEAEDQQQLMFEEKD
jgi:hypothetical protein